MGKKLLISVILISFLAGSLVTGSIVAEDGLTKLQKQCAKEPKTPQKIKPDCELLALINAIPASTPHTVKYTDADAVSAIESSTLSSVTTSGNYLYSSPQTRSVVIFPVEFASTFDVDWLVPLKGAAGVIKSSSTKSFLFASIPQLPDGATITRLDCRVFDNDGVKNLGCSIVRKSFASDVGEVIADVETSGASASNQDISDTSINTPVVDRDTFGYVVRYDAPPACDESCKLFSAKVTYTIDKVE